MNTPLPRFARARAGALGLLGLTLLAAACESTLPTTAEVERMDVAALEARTLELRPGENQDVRYFVDDREMSAEQAHALAGDQIVRMEVNRAESGGSIVRIYTNAGADAARVAPEGPRRQPAPEGVRVETESGTGMRTPAGFEGLLVIDGVVTDRSAMERLAPDAIESVDVMKGAAARALYDDPRAANGVIRITTKAAGGTR